ncbi:MAG: translation elongation factor Ts [Gammaproteobacteria bacterium]
MITAELVRDLRERTGAGLMDCKRALTETQGDMDAAIELMRIKGQASAGKKASRVTAEGRIAIETQGMLSAMVEVNCETDFVGRDENFINFSQQVAQSALTNNSTATDLCEADRQALVAKIGENIQIRRVAVLAASGIYLHGSRIGVLIKLEGGTPELAKDLAMHIAASNPQVVNPEEVPADLVQKEKEIFMAQALESGKPKEIIEKMIGGRIKKYLDEISLLGQPYVKNPDISVGELLQRQKAKVISFVRFEVGEGIEKKIENFAEEVMAQIKGT